MKRSIAIADRRTYTDGWWLCLVLLLGAVLVALLWTTAASGATAYYSLEGYLHPAVGPHQLFGFKINPALRSPAPFLLRTWHHGGGVNAAGDAIPSGSFDPILQLFGSSGVIATNDDGPFGLDSLIDWSTTGMPAQLPAGAYGVDLYPYSGGGDWAVDLLADAAKFSFTGASSYGTDLGAIYSLKIGSDDPRVPAKFELAPSDHFELYYHYELDAELVLGKSGSAEALIEGDLDTGHSVIGWEPDSFGTMILDYGSWHDHFTYGATYIGLFGEGNLEVRQGGDARFDNNLVLGWSADSEGNLLVSGPYAYAQVYSSIEIGAGGTGTVRVENQGHLNSYLLGNQNPDVVASLPLSTGTVDIDGHESLWETDPLVVGNAGQGIVRVTNGGKIDTHGSAYIGKTSGAAASSVTVAGLSPEITEATWLIDRNLHIAGDESGPSSAAFSKLVISTGGLVDVSGTTTVWESGGSLELRGGEMETGSLIVKPGATFTHTGGALTVSGGTFDPGVTTHIITGATDGDRPKLVLDAGAVGTLAGAISVGREYAGELVVGAGSVLTATEMETQNWSSASPTISKASVAGTGAQLILTGVPSNVGSVEIGGVGQGELHVSAGGKVRALQGGVCLACNLVNPQGSGQIIVEGQDSELQATSFVFDAIGADSQVIVRDRASIRTSQASDGSSISPISSHQILVDVADSGSSLQVQNRLLSVYGGSEGGTARLRIRNGATAHVTGDFWIIGGTPGAAYVEIDGDSAGSAAIIVDNTLYVGGDATHAVSGVAQLIIVDGGSISADSVKVWQPGSIELSGANIHTGSLALEGTLRGTGGVTGGGQLSNSGLVSPGLLTPGMAIGTIHVAGDYAQLAGGALKMEIGGLAPSQVDRLQVDGAATLGGSLRIDLVDPTGGSNPFQPSAGDSFPLLTAGLLSPPGFGDVILPELGPELRMVVVADLQSSILSAQVFLSGDYNFNGIVDAADYTVWRDTLGSTTDLRANGDNTGLSAGVIDGADYLAWKSRFGVSAGGGAGAILATSAAVEAVIPEPAIGWLVLTLAAILTMASARRCRVVRFLVVAVCCVALWNAPQGVDAALTGHCYNGWSIVDGLIDFSAAANVADREDPNLDYWDGSPYHTWRIVPGSNSNFGVEWVGFVRVDQPGKYGFGTISDDGSQVWIDDALIVDNYELQWYDWEDNINEGDSTGASFPPLDLAAGYHSIRVRWYEQYSFSGIELWWLTPGAGTSDIPYYGQNFHGINPTFNPNTNWAIVPASNLFTAIPALLGDYSANGVVDAADYTVWRDTLGSTTDMRANGDDTGASASVIDGADYLAWKSHFGQMAGSGSSGGRLDAVGSPGVPEPVPLRVLLGALCSLMLLAERSKRMLE